MNMKIKLKQNSCFILYSKKNLLKRRKRFFFLSIFLLYKYVGISNIMMIETQGITKKNTERLVMRYLTFFQLNKGFSLLLFFFSSRLGIKVMKTLWKIYYKSMKFVSLLGFHFNYIIVVETA